MEKLKQIMPMLNENIGPGLFRKSNSNVPTVANSKTPCMDTL